MFLDKHILSIFEAGFMKNLSIFEPQIEKHYACKKKHVPLLKTFHPKSFEIEILSTLLVENNLDKIIFPSKYDEIGPENIFKR